ncbi:MAG: TonB-dependent receptor [Terracidiphilus sp.]
MRRTFWRSVAQCSLVFGIALVCLSPGSAQQTLGSINGTVLDPSGAAVAGATITVTNTAINLTRRTASQGTGFYQLFNLPVGTYEVTVTHQGFETTQLKGISVKEAAATTVNATLKVGKTTESVEVTANPLLNATDTTNGYTLDSSQIQLTPLATGSFTQLAVLAPGVNAELLANLDTNAGLGNQNIWANGQRATSNTMQVNGVDVTNIFNGMTSSGLTSQRYNFGVGETDAIGGEYGTGTSVYESNGNSLPSPPPETIQELRVNTSMYDAQQGATAGAQIDVNTAEGTNKWHGQVFSSFANNSLNAAPFFFKQEYLLTAQQGVGAFPEALANPALHRWGTGATLGGPVFKNKLFFFAAYQHSYNSDQGTGLSQVNVPSGLTDDRSTTGLENALTSWFNDGSSHSVTISPIASAIMNAKLPNGEYMIPSAQTSAQYSYGVPNVTLQGTSMMTNDQAVANLDYDLSKTDRVSFKYYYQNDPVNKPYGLAQVGGFPLTQNNGSQVGALDNTISIGPRLNWEQRLGYVRMYSNSFDKQTVTPDATLGPTFGIGTGTGLYTPGVMPGLDLLEFASDFSTDAPSVRVGPYSTESTTVNTGYFQNRLNPSSNLIFSIGKHTIVAGGGYSYTQLNIENNRNGLVNVEAKTFESFLEGDAYKSNVIDSIPPPPAAQKNSADRYYRSNEIGAYLQDKWQLLSNLSITAGVRYDYHGGLTEKYGNMFNFDPSLYSVSGTSTTGFTVNNAGFVVAPNNSYAKSIPATSLASSDSTLTGRQWGISPRVGFAWSPKQDNGKIVLRGGAGMYYDRGELFSYLSQPYGASGGGGVFGVTQSAPLATYINGNGKLLSDPLGTPTYVPPSANPANITAALQTQLENMTGSDPPYGPNCGAIDNQENYLDCTPTIDFGAYGNNNVLPYTINYTLDLEWQPSNDVSVDIGYVGNRGRHSVIPIPFNEPGIATPSNPIWGETSSYGWQVLNQNSTYVDGYGTTDFNSIAGEPWNTASGGNIDFRVPYVGYNFNSALFKTVGVSAYDALQAHLEKRLSHYFQAGVSYTWSHALDEQSDIGIFFTGDNPNNLRDSWGSADFDRTNVFTANFMAVVPNFAKAHSFLAYAANGWNLTGVVTAQSGEPYSLYEFYGAVGSLYVGNYPNLMNPVLPIKTPGNPKAVFTGNKGSLRGPGGSYIPAIDPTQIAINYLAPGDKGIPMSTGSDPQDIYETDFAPSDQRNIFRQAFQKRADVSFRKNFQITEKIGLLYAFNIFNLFNTTSLDVPQNQTQIAQSYACSNSAVAIGNYNNTCPQNNSYLNYGQIATSNQPTDQQSALANEYVLPVVNGSGKSLTVPTTLTNGQGTCTSYGYASSAGCPNNGATFGSVTGAIGGSRAITMGIHLTF